MKASLVGPIALTVMGCASYYPDYQDQSRFYQQPAHHVVYDSSPVYNYGSGYLGGSYYDPFGSSVSIYRYDVPSYYHWAPYYDPFYLQDVWHLPRHRHGHRPYYFSWYSPRHSNHYSLWSTYWHHPFFHPHRSITWHHPRERARNKHRPRAYAASDEATRLTTQRGPRRRDGAFAGSPQLRSSPDTANTRTRRGNPRRPQPRASDGGRVEANPALGTAIQRSRVRNPERSQTRRSRSISADQIRPRPTREISPPSRAPSVTLRQPRSAHRAGKPAPAVTRIEQTTRTVRPTPSERATRNADSPDQSRSSRTRSAATATARSQRSEQRPQRSPRAARVDTGRSRAVRPTRSARPSATPPAQSARTRPNAAARKSSAQPNRSRSEHPRAQRSPRRDDANKQQRRSRRRD